MMCAWSCRYPDFTTTDSGLQFKDMREGTGETPRPGDTLVVDWWVKCMVRLLYGSQRQHSLCSPTVHHLCPVRVLLVGSSGWDNLCTPATLLFVVHDNGMDVLPDKLGWCVGGLCACCVQGRVHYRLLWAPI